MYMHTKIIEKGLVLYTERERERESERKRGVGGGRGREVKHKGRNADII
jgi:hypothetical protein